MFYYDFSIKTDHTPNLLFFIAFYDADYIIDKQKSIQNHHQIIMNKHIQVKLTFNYTCTFVVIWLLQKDFNSFNNNLSLFDENFNDIITFKLNNANKNHVKINKYLLYNLF